MNSNLPRKEFVVTDIRMLFASMISLMVKWGVASISAMITLLVLGALFGAVLITRPTIIKSQIPPHEASALTNIRAINEAEMIYATSHRDLGFTGNLAMLGDTQIGGEGIIDNNLARGRKSGYTFTYKPGEKVNGAIRAYTVTAVPDQVGLTGYRTFYSDEAGDIHYTTTGIADASSPVLH